MSDSLISCKIIACGLLLAGLALTSATVPAYAEDWNKNYQIVESGFVKVGGTEKNRYEVILNKSYDNIFFGYAENTSAECKQSESPYEYNEAECNYVTGILAAGGSGTVIIGGRANAIMLPCASDNTIIMQSGSSLIAGSDGQKYGGYGTDPNIDGGCVYGGYATSTYTMPRAIFNTVIFKKGSTVKSEGYRSHFAIHGGAVYSIQNPTASNNKVIFEKGVSLPGDENEVDIIGGLATTYASGATASENYIGLNSGTFYSLVGSYTQGYNVYANKNHALLTDVKAKYFEGCQLNLLENGGNATANYNEFTLRNVFFDREVIGCAINALKLKDITIFRGELKPSKKYTINAEGNKLTIIDADIQNTVKGVSFEGYETDQSKETDSTISSNVLTLKGGSYKYNICGFYYRYYADSATAENSKLYIEHNTVALWKGSTMPEFSDKTIISGYDLEATMDLHGRIYATDNTLELHEVCGLTAGNIRNFTNIAFDLPDMKADSAVMTLTEYITKFSKIHLDVQVGSLTGADGGEFKIGEKIFLLKNSNGIEVETLSVNVMPEQHGYLFDVKADETSIYLTRIR